MWGRDLVGGLESGELGGLVDGEVGVESRSLSPPPPCLGTVCAACQVLGRLGTLFFLH